MFVLVDAGKDWDGKYCFTILDTDDLVCEEFTGNQLTSLYKQVPNLNIEGLKYDAESDKLKIPTSSKNEYGNKYHKVGDNFSVVTKRRNGNTCKVYYEILVYKRGIDLPFWHGETPKSEMDYLTFNFDDLDGKYLVIDISGVDKHFYAEDREEYFGMYIILDSKGSHANEIRHDKSFTQQDYLDWYTYENGVLNPNYSS